MARLPISKSICNRALILQSFAPSTVDLHEISEAEDVVDLHRALLQLREGQREFSIRAGGTAFRFLVARLSRLSGRWRVRAGARLLARPHDELRGLLGQLGVEIRPHDWGWEIESKQGWRDLAGGEIDLSSGVSSQFATALMLSSLNLPHELVFRWSQVVSSPYLEMTLSLLKDWCGLEAEVSRSDRRLVVPAGAQVIRSGEFRVEPDISSAFAIAGWSLFQGGIRLPNCALERSLQPDVRFVALLERMGAKVQRIGTDLTVFPIRGRLQSIQVDIQAAPDLFPVLCALAACARGRSEIVGGSHLALKESNRIEGVRRLLLSAGVVCGPLEDRGLWVEGQSGPVSQSPVAFDPDRDHRLAFAAEVLRAAGWPIEVTEKSVVEKSFPRFYEQITAEPPTHRPVVFIGQRGVGKSTHLEQAVAQGVFDIGIDLDREIESRTRRSISDWLAEGEDGFRNAERDVFRSIAKEVLTRSDTRFGIAVGAGFDISEIPKSMDVTWVRRRSDFEARIFSDRPKLDPNLSDSDEYISRSRKREQGYSARADHVLWMPEASPRVRGQSHEEATQLRGWTTTLSTSFAQRDDESLQRHLRDLRLGEREVELRDDLLSPEALNRLWPILGQSNPKVLFSVRTGDGLEALLRRYAQYGGGLRVDIASEWLRRLSELERQELVQRLKGLEVWLSCHEADWQDWIRSPPFPEISERIKLAPQVGSFSELLSGDRWQRKAPDRRAFLPSSQNGRWLWYRLLRPGPLAFVFEHQPSAADQPTPAELVRARAVGPAERFAAVLGSDVALSWSPSEHQEFFWTRERLPYLAVNIGRDEWPEAWPVLEELGLRAASVTSPHKRRAGEVSGQMGRSVNTLWRRRDGRWVGRSTDEVGAREAWLSLRRRFDPTGHWRQVVVWGGGGILDAVRRAVEGLELVEWSARLRKARSGTQIARPDVLIWAAGRDVGSGTSDPPWPPEWKPAVVWDLGYHEGSPVLGWSRERSFQVVNGAEFFCAQAREQQVFWREEAGT